MLYFIPMIPIILEPSKLVRNLPLHKKIKNEFKILQTKEIIKFIICLNCKVFIETVLKSRNAKSTQAP